MSYVVLYFVIGAIIAVWTGINQLGRENIDLEATAREGRTVLFIAYVMIALMWPLSIVISFYTIISQLLLREN